MKKASNPVFEQQTSKQPKADKMNPPVTTENGALSCTIDRDSPLVGVLYHLVRGCDKARLNELLTALWNLGFVVRAAGEPLDSRLLCVKAVANLRDPRGGKGERDLGRWAWQWLLESHPEVFRLNLNWLVSEGCRLDDLLHFGESGLQEVARLLKDDQSTVLRELRRLCGDDKFAPSAALAKFLELTEVDILGNKGHLKQFFELAFKELETAGCAFRGKTISLMAKWAPTEGGAWARKSPKAFARLLSLLRCSARQYRVVFLTPLRKYLDIVEARMCADDWKGIVLPNVPSRALHKLRGAFRKHIPDELEAYLEAVKAGRKEIKADQLVPHDLVRVYMGSIYGSAHELNEVTELQWKALVAKFGYLFGQRSMAIVDVSGSMSGTPMEVAIALGLLTAAGRKFCLGQDRERFDAYLQTDAGQAMLDQVPAMDEIIRSMGFDAAKHHPLNGKVITFSEHPDLFTIPEGSLRDQVRAMQGMNWGMSTNFQAALELMLATARSNQLHAADFPEVLYVFSDMQFNVADRNFSTNHRALKQKFAAAGYRLPVIVYWNLRGDTRDCPIDNDEELGVVLLSGFSPDVLKAVMEGKLDTLTPLAVALKVLLDPRYDALRIE